jgi:putative membrane protein
MKKTTALSLLYAVFILFISLLFGYFVKQGNWLQTDLHTLLPSQQEWADVQVLADQQQEKQLNSQIIALIGHADEKQAFQLTDHIAQTWRSSKLFSHITDRIQPNLTELQQDIQLVAFATLPQTVREQLINDPKGYFQQYAEDIINPFKRNNLLSLEQDWLGFGRFAQKTQQGNVQWHAENGMLTINQDNMTWVLLRAELQQNDFINPSEDLTALLTKNHQYLTQSGAQFKVTGSALFAADAKQKAEKESTLMSVMGVSLTLLLLLIVFRTLRILWLFLPILIGMLSGVVATVWGFGQIHILTLVIGTSLVGVLIDFPLHWLAGSLFDRKWVPLLAMQKLRFTFFISLLVTLLGYGLLAFTHLPILQQTALFSAVSLITALLATQLFLPYLFYRYQPTTLLPERKTFNLIQKGLNTFANKRFNKGTLLIISLLVLGGGIKSSWHDDIRQWVSMPQSMLNEAKTIGKLTGVDLGSQYFLLTAENEALLLEKDAKLSKQLAQRNITFKSLSQWISPLAEQEQLAEYLQHISADDYAVLNDIGVPTEKIQQNLTALSQHKPLTLSEALNTQLGQAWKMLYLGELAPNQVASIIKISQADSATMQALANNRDIFWQDKRAYLNQAFKEAKEQAAWLKIISFVIAGLLLWKIFEIKTSIRILFIPCIAILGTIAIFGWIDLPIGLFSMFGLLLVSAIGIDYAVYMKTVNEEASHKRITLTLAACTTLISFLLLAISSTPAVATFGISVSIGVIISLLTTLKLMR